MFRPEVSVFGANMPNIGLPRYQLINRLRQQRAMV